MSSFSQWDTVHSLPEQLNRQKSALKSELTPLSVNYIDSTGIFQGSKYQYNCSLEKCSCVDFATRKMPCKHMYRLAMELELFPGEFISDISKSRGRVSDEKTKAHRPSVNFSTYIDMIETLSEDAQKDLKEILYYITCKRKHFSCRAETNPDELLSSHIIENCGQRAELLNFFTRNELNKMIEPLNIPFKKNMKMDDLKVWCVDNLSDRWTELFTGFYACRISPDYEKHNTALYRYLHRKFDSDLSANVSLLDTELPDDKVTKELIRKGLYPRNVKKNRVIFRF